jgi:hypothetical protein
MTKHEKFLHRLMNGQADTDIAFDDLCSSGSVFKSEYEATITFLPKTVLKKSSIFNRLEQKPNHIKSNKSVQSFSLTARMRTRSETARISNDHLLEQRGQILSR